MTWAGPLVPGITPGTGEDAGVGDTGSMLWITRQIDIGKKGSNSVAEILELGKWGSSS